MKENKDYPLLITRGIVILPKCSAVLDVGRTFSILAVSNAISGFNSDIVVVSQKNINAEDNLLGSIYQEGTLCHITSSKEENNGILKVRLIGVKHVRLLTTSTTGSKDSTFYYNTSWEEVKTIGFKDQEVERQYAVKLANALIDSPASKLIPPSLTNKMRLGMSTEDLVNQLAYHIVSKLQVKQEILEEVSLEKRITRIINILTGDANERKIDTEINQKMQDKANKMQKEYYLREKLRAVQDELDELTGEKDDDEELLKKVENGNYPLRIKEKIKRELKKVKNMASGSLEASMQRSYIDWLVTLPWCEFTKDNDSIEHARNILDEDHYGLQKVKERILEYLAVKVTTKSLKAPILCLYGPPGVGKTSLAKSIARALDRKFVKASLGGVSDEAEIRGHRRTYVASMPGKIIKGIKNAGVSNPVFLLDEIDKLTSNVRGDPASALLEVLDPEQNAFFQDSYLEETYDLSNVLFICTANYLENIPPALRDRLELIELNTYTEEEKINIAKEHLIKKECENNGLKETQIRFDDDALKMIINSYTREAGVRELQRKIATCCRKAIVELISSPRKRKVVVDKKKVKEYLGIEVFSYTMKNKLPQVGVVTGLAYTQYGGDILPIETTFFKGKGNLILTGKLGEVMKESATIALSYVKANAERYKIDSALFNDNDIHIHVPEGAVPKDGPSAGVALTCALVSLFKNIPCLPTVAMTGEVNLRGQSTAIGGLKEKSLAAYRSGIKKILIPLENKKNIEELPNSVKENLEIVTVSSVDEALKGILENYDFLEQ